MTISGKGWLQMSFSLGLVEVSSLGHAITMADEMLKAADVEFAATERRLGGRLVTIVVKGEISAVEASVEAGSRFAKQTGCFKAAEVIARPHPEIFKFLHLEEKKEEAKPAKTSSKAVKASDKKVPAKRDRKQK